MLPRSFFQFLVIEILLGVIAWAVGLFPGIDAQFKQIIRVGCLILGILVLLFYAVNWLGVGPLFR